MLVLSRRANETIVIAGGTNQEVRVTVLDIRGDKVRLGIVADKLIAVNRQEVQEQIDREGLSQ